MTLRRQLAGALALVMASLAQPGIAKPETPAPRAVPVQPGTVPAIGFVDRPALFNEDDLLLFEVDADKAQLSDGLGAYSSRAGVFLPLGELSRLLDLSITVDAAKGRAEGWILNEQRTLRLDMRSRTATVGDKTLAISTSDAAIKGDEIYVRTPILEQLLPLKFKADTNNLLLTLTPTEKLPFQERQEREQRRDRLGDHIAAQDEVILRVPTPYRLFTPPAFDVNLSAAYSSKAPQTMGSFDVRMSGDLAYAGMQFFAQSDEGGRLSDVSLVFERKDPSGHAVGLPGLTRASGGDVYIPSLSIGARGKGGRGMSITSAPLQEANIFDKINLRGELPIGYEVELYVDEVLRASQATPVSGRYEFQDVSLSFGMNVIRLVFYGAHGERRQEVRRFNVGAGELAKGQFTYSLGAVQVATPLVDVRPASRQAVPGVGTGDLRLVGQVGYGLSSKVTLTAGFADYTPAPGLGRQMGQLGIATSLAGLATQTNIAADDRGGAAVSLGVGGRPFGISIIGKDSEYFGGFIDETAPSDSRGSALVRDSSISLDYIARIAGPGGAPLNLRFARDQFADGATDLTLTARVSKPVNRYLLSSAFEYKASGGGGQPQVRTLNGSIDAGGLVGKDWQVRGAVGYDVFPQSRVNTFVLTADHDLSQKGALRLAIQQSFGATSSTALSVSTSWHLINADFSINGNYNSASNDYRLGVQLSLGAIFDSFTNRYRRVGPGAASGGALEIQSFIDSDGDGRITKGERPMPGITADGGRRIVTTDQHGVALVTGLGDGALARVRLDLTNVDDPYLTSPPRTIEIVPRAGRLAVVTYPLSPTGEVEIRVRFNRVGQGLRGLSALAVQLMSDDGRVIATGRTEYDGSLLLQDLRAGVYAIRIDPNQAERLKLGLLGIPKVIVGKNGGFVGRVETEAVIVGAASSVAATPPAASSVASPSTSRSTTITAKPVTIATPHAHIRPHHRRPSHRHHGYHRKRPTAGHDHTPIGGIACRTGTCQTR